MSGNHHISLFWWSEPRLMSKKKENYGDLLSKYLVGHISGKAVKWVHPKKQPWFQLNKKHFLGTGSIIHHVNKFSIVWGSGIIDEFQPIENAEFCAVRGPETRRRLINLGYKCPEIYGDPALLLPNYYKPAIKKKYKLGIIPHYTDFKMISTLYANLEGIKVIDIMTMNVEEKTNEILACEKIVSSSLHGIIIPHAYNIPALWIPFSKKPFGSGIKYFDYLKSVEINNYNPPIFSDQLNRDDFLSFFDSFQALPKKEVVKQLKEGLMLHCPFKT
jgi:pyruvyltransferase